MSKLLCCVLLGLLLVTANVSAAGLLDNLPIGDLTNLVPCLFKCPCSDTCLPKPGLDPLLHFHCVDVSVELNLTCPSLAVDANVCCELGASCYTSCGSLKTVCDVSIKACLLTVGLKLNLCDKNLVQAHLDLLKAELTLCDRYRDAQKYGCECGGNENPSVPGGGNENPSLPGGGNENPSLPGGGNPSLPGGENPSLPGGGNPSVPGGGNPSVPGGGNPSLP